MPAGFFYDVSPLEPQQFGEFDDECSILKQWRASQFGVTDVVIDDKQFATWLVFPP